MSDEEIHVPGHAFLCYVREDSEAVDRLQRVLAAADIPVWRDKSDLWPGEDWRAKIRQAITRNALAFIVCLSQNSNAREEGYQYEELQLAIEQARRRRPDTTWLIPVRLDDCAIPDLEIGPGRMLASIQHADLFGDRSDEGVARLVATVLRILGRSAPVASGGGGQIRPKPAATDRWRLTHSIAEASAMTQLDQQWFTHPAYRRREEHAALSVRVRVVIACEPLGEEPEWQDLRRLFAAFLSQDGIARLISELACIPAAASWCPRATRRRPSLEADLTIDDDSALPVASAKLELPDGHAHTGLLADCAVLTVHADFLPMPRPKEKLSRRPPYWRSRFQDAIALARDLREWLETQIGLATYNDPIAQVGILLTTGDKPITEMVDATGIPALPADSLASHFSGWAVADESGKTVQDLADTMMLDLSERVLHLDGTKAEMSGLTDPFLTGSLLSSEHSG